VAVILLAAVFFLTLEVVFALARGNETPLAIARFRELLTTTVLVAGGFFLFGHRDDGFPRFAQAMFVGAAVHSLAKLAALDLILSGQGSFAKASDRTHAQSGPQVMGLELEGSLPRFHMGQGPGHPVRPVPGAGGPAGNGSSHSSSPLRRARSGR
jgi:hypothetical protein